MEAVQIETKSRLWGEWEPRFYGSGTTIVVLRKYLHKPHLYIYADKAISEARNNQDRYEMCNQLTAFMNGGARPAWLDDFDRTSERDAMSLAGGSISATGPMVDRDPPKLHWFEDESDEANDDRARLMDVLFIHQ